MKKLWAPWRMEYILKTKKRRCFLCKTIKERQDRKNFILLRTKKAVSLLNIYPYSNGHVMVVPKRHINSLEKLESQEMQELFFHMGKILTVLKKTLKPEGFNVGLNLGRIAGAGQDKHLHFHIVPRWQGDTNFMPILSDTKVIPQSLKQTYKKIKEALDGQI